MGTAERVLNEQAEYDITEDEFYYGTRTVVTYDENGKSLFSEYPLTLEDFLEPEEGDEYMQGSLHEDDVIRLRSIFRYHLKDRGNITVYSDMKIIWGIEGLKNPAPDISVIENVKDPEKPRGSFYVTEEGTKPFFVLEVVSPRYRDADINRKPDIYRRAGVSEYIIADPGLEGNRISYTVSGYRLIGSRYIKIKPDSNGRIRSMTAGVLIGAVESGTGLAVYDASTGCEILSDDERAEYAEERAEHAEERAEYAENRAEYAEERAEHAEERAEQEKTRAESAEKELMRLKAKMKALGIPGD